MVRLLALAVFACALLAQNYGAVEGTVTDSISHTGIADATVQLRAADGRLAGYVARTDATGNFHIENVLPGDYLATYSAQKYQAPNTDRDAYRPFRVSAGGTVVRLQGELVPLGKLSARVLDEDGNPVARAQLMLLRQRGGGGAAGTTDAQGRLDMNGIEAGDYILLARPVLAGTVLGEKAQNRSSLPSHPKEGERYQWAPTYYPNALIRSEGQVIQIRGGSDLSGYAIRLRSTPVYRVGGVVLDDQGAVVPKAVLKLPAHDALIAGVETQVAAGADGRFEFPSVAPGDWRITAEAESNHVLLKGAAPVTVGRRDVEDLSIRLSRPFVVSVLVDREDKPDVQGRRVVTGLQLVDVNHETGANAFQGQDGSFQIKDVYSGRYRLIPLGFVPGYYVDSIWLGDSNVMGQEVDLSASSPPIRVVYQSNAARVRGTVESGGGSVVYLVPQDESLLNTPFIRSVPCDAAGRFELGSVRPGDYYIFAFDHADFAALTDPAFIRTIAPLAATVHVDAGGIGSVNVKVTAWPE
jgi:hypothetical protein